MEFARYFPVWNKLTPQQQDTFSQSVISSKVSKGTVIHNGSMDCAGLLIIKSGQFRAYILSDEGREITVYRLFDMDICLFSASCVMNSVQFEIIIEAEKDSEFWTIPPYVFKSVMEQSAPLANYVNELMATRFSEVMWLIEQVMWKSFDRRLAHFLIEESAIENSTVLKTTHEIIASHLGSAREVVTRMLKYFQNEGMVKLTRGTIEIIDMDKLEELDE